MSVEFNIHPLLQKPDAISIPYRNALAEAHGARLAEVAKRPLAETFKTADSILVPPVPVTIYYFSDNDGRLSDTAPKEIDGFIHDPANVVSGLTGIQKPTIVHRDTLAQGWPTGGFDLAQTTRYSMLNEPGQGIGKVTFLNCAPRIDERGQEGNKTNKGEPVYVGVLPNGHVITANSRYNFAHFRDMVENGTLELYEANVQTDGTQFRSRDIFPLHTVVLANSLTQNMDLWLKTADGSIESRKALLESVGFVDTAKKLTLEDIPELEQFTVANIDVHGNIKTNTRLSDLNSDVIQRLRSLPFKIEVTIGEGDEAVIKELPARFTEKMFDRKTDEGGLSEGSSGSQWQGAVHDDGFLEISIIGGDAAKELGIDPEALRKPIQIRLPGIFADNDVVPAAPTVSRQPPAQVQQHIPGSSATG